ncbi:MAG: hypothetical protein RJA55_1250 [Acidobacteriota bacterium]
MKIIITLAAVALAAALGQPLIDRDGVLSFARATEDYAFMHRRLERRLPAMEVNAKPETIRQAIDAMAAAVHAARPDARQGDFFNPRVQAAIRVRIARALQIHGLTPADVRAAELADGIDPAGVTLHINGAFPWAIGTAMVPCILEALPPLPPELQYRMVGRDLVLIDVHASLVIDILAGALAESGTVDK